MIPQTTAVPSPQRMIVKMKQLQDMVKNNYPTVSLNAMVTSIMMELYGEIIVGAPAASDPAARPGDGHHPARGEDTLQVDYEEARVGARPIDSVQRSQQLLVYLWQPPSIGMVERPDELDGTGKSCDTNGNNDR